MILVALVYSIQVYNITHYPSQIDIVKGESQKLDMVFPFTVGILDDEDNILKLDDSYSQKLGLKIKNSYNFNTIEKGMAKLQLKLLGIIPIRDIRVNVIDEIYLIPGGNAIGVKLNTKGVLVVALSEISGIDGKNYNPAKDAGIRVGDSIVSIDGVKNKNSYSIVN